MCLGTESEEGRIIGKAVVLFIFFFMGFSNLTCVFFFLYKAPVSFFLFKSLPLSLSSPFDIYWCSEFQDFLKNKFLKLRP